MQESVLKVNEYRTFCTPGCQGISCFPISRTSFLGSDGVPFYLTFLWCGDFERDKFLVSDLISFGTFKK